MKPFNQPTQFISYSLLLLAVMASLGCKSVSSTSAPDVAGAAPISTVAKAPPGKFELSKELVGGQYYGSSFPCFEQQDSMNWCWASCIQSVLCQAGSSRTQVQIAADLDGWPRDRPAHINEVVGLLNAYGLRSWTVTFPASPDQLYRTLLNGYRIIALANPQGQNVGHFIVLQGVTPSGEIVVSDPWTGQTGIQTPADLYYGWKWRASAVVGR